MPVQWMAEAPPACEIGTRAPQEDDTMAGYVQGHMELRNDDSYDVVPLVCPAADDHTQGTPRCATRMFDGDIRACPYFSALTHVSNFTHRMSVSALRQEAVGLNARQVRCGVLCLRQRANRPPGC